MALPKPLFTKYSLLTVNTGTDAAPVETSYECQTTTSGLQSDGGDLVSQSTQCPDGSFSESTPRTWSLAVTAVQDVETDEPENLMLFALDHEGETVGVTWYPKTDADKNPVGFGWKGPAKVGAPSAVGGGDIGAYATFDAVFAFQGKPVRVDETGQPVTTSAASVYARTQTDEQQPAPDQVTAAAEPVAAA